VDKGIGFLSFGHCQPVPGSQVRTGRDALVQNVELAVAAEQLGLDGAYVRVPHFARQLASPFPLLSAMAVRTQRIELGTGVIDMRYENPLYMAAEALGYLPLADGDDGELAREKTGLFLAAISGATVVDADPRMTGGASGH
jgi:alkanesulfonate monooxygenase SsuD/methylene tetrahydromethanopterin reductase-like flavin-dependent oxidoreductase (luciferase family)